MNSKWLLCTALFASCATPSGEVQPASSDLKVQAASVPTLYLSVGQITRPALVTITAQVASNVIRVEFFQDGRSIGVDTQAPFTAQALFVKTEQATRGFTVKAFAAGTATSSQTSQLRVNITGRVLFVAPDGAYGNDGLSEARALPRLQSAMNLTIPGDTVLVKNGTYSKKDYPLADVVTISRSGRANAWIAMMAYPGQKPKIESVNWSAIKVQASYIIVDGF